MELNKKIIKYFIIILSLATLIPLFECQLLFGNQKSIILATTTSTQDSGLLDVLIPIFEKKTGYLVKTIAVGSGQAIAMAKRGEADVLLVHSPKDEEKFMGEGFGINRRIVMHNDFILVGPHNDRANIKGNRSIFSAFKKIALAKTLFISRGDKSGTNMKELEIWKRIGINPEGERWYIETGLGMGLTLNVASEKEGYTLTDRGTYLALKKNIQLDIMVEKDPFLFNIYHVIEVNPKKWPKVNNKGAKAFSDFIVSKEAQEIIKNFGIEKFGVPLFYPDAYKK
jgi:tungstate transport system substrate-binding protein